MNRKSARKKKEWTETLIFTTPALILVSLMIYIPFVMSGYYSLTEWNGIAKEPVFIGFDNFKKLFSSGSTFAGTLWFTIRYTLFFMLFSNVAALALAVALTQKFRLADVYRGLFFIPYIMSMTIVGFIWKFIFTKGFEKLFSLTSLEFLNLSWLGDPKLAFYSVSFVGVWQALGFYIVLYIAGLQAIPKDVLEAARVDGASAGQTFFRVTLPLLGPSITTCVFMSLTNGLKVFDIILALTKGGPGTSTYSTTMQIYQEAFTNNNYGLGSAQAIIYFVFVLITTQLVLRVMSRREVDL
ncbi:MAG: sugar ABC transporter permease [Lachnospiraceae bacterium]|nr:sugar ABC transporter permease [Lachnospiraceae bacterium]